MVFTMEVLAYGYKRAKTAGLTKLSRLQKTNLVKLC